MIKALSHIVIAVENVEKVSITFSKVFQIKPHFINADFSDFVLPDKRRIAFFRPTGKAKEYFKATHPPENQSIGITVENVDLCYEEAKKKETELEISFSGPPKEHPWGEKSFLLIDSAGNRFEITQAPSDEGHLVDIH